MKRSNASIISFSLVTSKKTSENLKKKKRQKPRVKCSLVTVWHEFALVVSSHCLWVTGIFLQQFFLLLFLGHLNTYEYGHPVDLNVWKTLHGNQQYMLTHTIFITLSSWVWSERKTRGMSFLSLLEADLWGPLVLFPCSVFAISFILVESVLV